MHAGLPTKPLLAQINSRTSSSKMPKQRQRISQVSAWTGPLAAMRLPVIRSFLRTEDTSPSAVERQTSWITIQTEGTISSSAIEFSREPSLPVKILAEAVQEMDPQ